MAAGRGPTFVVVGLAVAAGIALAAGPAPHQRTVPPTAGRGLATPEPPSSSWPSPSASPSPGPATSTPPSAGPKALRSPVAARPGAAAARAGNLASRLRTLPSGTRQVIVVHSDGYAATTATVETFQKTGDGWRPALRTMTARIGMRGFTDHKVEGDLATPTGVYAIGATMYGIAADPGVRYRYHRLVDGDYWNENSASPAYNSFVHGADPGGGSEALWRTAPQYTYLAVINYNVPVRAASPPRGSAIFLHVIHPGYATAGCVALPQADLVSVLRWLDPAAAPRVVMAPRQALDRY